MICEAVPKRSSKSWVVVVTYGTQPYSIYACVPEFRTAMELLEVARSRGYRKPGVMRFDEYTLARESFFKRRYEKLMELKFDYLATVYGRGVAEKKREEWHSQRHHAAAVD